MEFAFSLNRRFFVSNALTDFKLKENMKTKLMILMASLLIPIAANAQSITFDCEYEIAGSKRVLKNMTDDRACLLIQQLAIEESSFLAQFLKCDANEIRRLEDLTTANQRLASTKKALRRLKHQVRNNH